MAGGSQKLRESPLQWRWVNETGVHNAVDARELVDALANGRMTPHVWVWRTGWKTWMRASQIAELAAAIPKGARLPPVAIDVDPGAIEPPPAPRYSFRASNFVRHTSTPVPRPVHQRQLIRRPASPTLIDAEPLKSQTLRPPGAVPPPPRGFSDNQTIEVQRAIDTATFASDSVEGDSTNRRSFANSTTLRPSIAPALVPKPTADFVMRSVLGESQPSKSRPSAATQAPKGFHNVLRSGIPLIAGAIVLGAGAALVWLRSTVPNQGLAKPAHIRATSAPVVLSHCRAVTHAERIAPNVAFQVPPSPKTAGDGQSVAIGFADAATTASGVVVDPVSLSVKYVFRRSESAKIASVVPAITAGRLLFDVALESDKLKDVQSIGGTPPVVFGLSQDGFARQTSGGPVEVVWPVELDVPISGTRLASLQPLGHVVTYRQGGKTGALWAGWLTPDGRNKVLPAPLRTDAKFVGQPSIAAGATSALVTYAARASERDNWQIRMIQLSPDGQQTLEHVFETPTGGPGGEAIAPSAVALDQGRYLLQWSEGTAGKWQVRVQMLGGNLQAEGAPLNVSPPDLNAGQGVLWINGAQALSLFIVNVNRSAELWATPIECPR